MILTSRKLSQFKDWNIDMILFEKELSGNYPMVKLGKIITPRKEKIKASDIPRNRYVVSKIRFIDGCVFFKDRVIKNDMNKSCLNDLLVSNINFEKGAFSVNTWGDVYASTDYTSYIINTDVILPEFLFLTLRCSTFIEYVASVKPKGMKTRARYEFIKNFTVPVPSIEEQDKLLKKYHDTLDEAEWNSKAGDDYRANLLHDIQAEVSTLKKKEKHTSSATSLLSTVSFATTKRWEVDYIKKEGRLEEIYNSFKHPWHTINYLQIESLFGLSVKASLDPSDGMIPVLRMTNIVNGDIDYTELKYLPYECATTQNEPDKWILKDGDFLIARTNGSKDLVGKSAIFHNTGIYTYASYLIRYRFDTTMVLPEYVNLLFLTPIVREQIAVMRRQGGGQYNLNSDEIGSIRIPVPTTLKEQQEIVDYYNKKKKGSKAYYDKANALTKKAKTDFENAIFLKQI